MEVSSTSLCGFLLVLLDFLCTFTDSEVSHGLDDTGGMSGSFLIGVSTCVG